MGAESHLEEAQTGAFRPESGIRSWDEVVQRWCGLKWANPDENFDTLAAASWQPSSTDTMATHIRAIARLQREGKYRKPKTLVMAYLQWLCRRRAPNATVRGAIGAVRALEGMEWIEPIISKKLWRMAKYSLPGEDDDRRTFGGLETLRLNSQGCKDRVDWSFYGLAVLSLVGVLRVGEAVSVH